MAITLAGNNKAKLSPFSLQAIEGATDELRLSRVLAHNADHEGIFVQSCLFCAVKAANAIETHHPAEDQAQAFLATLEQSAVIDSIRHVRTAMKNDAPAWMFKAEYLR